MLQIRRQGLEMIAMHCILLCYTKIAVNISVYLLQHLEGHNVPYVAHSDSFEVGSEILCQ